MVMPADIEQYQTIYRPQPGKQEIFIRRKEDIAFYGGGKNSAKTFGLILDATAQLQKPGYHALLIRRDFPRLQEIIDRSHEIYRGIGGKWKDELHRYEFGEGKSVEFGHCQNEQDKFRYQGRGFQWIGFDQIEEFTESQYNFIAMQNRTSNPDIKCYVRLTGNPMGPGHFWVKRRFIDGKIPLKTYETVYPTPDKKRITRTYCYIPATIYDNPIGMQNNPTYIATLQAGTEEERRAYLEGDWTVLDTSSIFSSTKELQAGMKAQEQWLEEPVFQGYIKDAGNSLDLIPEKFGNLRIWRHYQEHKEYFIAADVAKGGESGDYSSAKVFDKANWGLCAKWHGHTDPSKFAEELYLLGAMYMWAEIAVEVWPGPGIATGHKLVDLQYPNLYRRFVWDGEKHVQSTEYGWSTDQRSRNEMIASLLEAIRRKQIIIRDQETLDEMREFIRHPNGKIAARGSCHDDQVIDTAIAIQCIKFNPVKEILDEDHNEMSRPIVVSSIIKSKNGFQKRSH